MTSFAIMAITGLLYTVLVIAVLFVFFYVAFKIIKFIAKAEKAIDIYLSKNENNSEM